MIQLALTMFRFYRGVKDFRIDFSMGIRNKNYAVQPRKFIMTSHGSILLTTDIFSKSDKDLQTGSFLSISDIGDGRPEFEG